MKNVYTCLFVSCQQGELVKLIIVDEYEAKTAPMMKLTLQKQIANLLQISPNDLSGAELISGQLYNAQTYISTGIIQFSFRVPVDGNYRSKLNSLITSGGLKKLQDTQNQTLLVAGFDNSASANVYGKMDNLQYYSEITQNNSSMIVYMLSLSCRTPNTTTYDKVTLSQSLIRPLQLDSVVYHLSFAASTPNMFTYDPSEMPYCIPSTIHVYAFKMYIVQDYSLVNGTNDT